MLGRDLRVSLGGGTGRFLEGLIERIESLSMGGGGTGSGDLRTVSGILGTSGMSGSRYANVWS